MLSANPIHRIAVAASILSATAALSLGGASAARAQGCTGAPGASALQQYCEAVPRADGGNDRPGGGGGNGGGGTKSSLPSGTASALADAGADGAAVERLAGSNSTETTTKKKAKTTSSRKTDGSSSTDDAGDVAGIQVEGPDDPSSSPLKAATNAAASGPTASQGVVWGLLGLTALGAVGAVFMRRNRGDLLPPEENS